MKYERSVILVDPKDHKKVLKLIKSKKTLFKSVSEFCRFNEKELLELWEQNNPPTK